MPDILEDIRNRLKQKLPPEQFSDKWTRQDELLVMVVEGLERLALFQGWQPGSPALPDVPGYKDIGVPDQQEFNITEARTSFKEVTFSACDYVQCICDGVMDGIKVYLYGQGENPILLNEFDLIPVRGLTRLFFTNDVRSGRSKLKFLFCRVGPLWRHIGGEGISRSELAARLGSPSTFDPRGEVVFRDAFNNGLKRWDCSITPGAVGASITTSTQNPKSGVRSCKMVTGDVIGKSNQIKAILPYIHLSPHGFEISFTVPSATLSYMWSFECLNGTRIITGKAGYNSVTQQLEIITPTASELIDSALLLQNLSYHTIKVVCDFNNHKYSRILVDNKIYDVSKYFLTDAASVGTPAIHVLMWVSTLANANQSIFADDAIVTRNEPV